MSDPFVFIISILIPLISVQLTTGILIIRRIDRMEARLLGCLDGTYEYSKKSAQLVPLRLRKCVR